MLIVLVKLTMEAIKLKIYRVNMSNLLFSMEDVPEEWKMLGGRGLTSAIVAKEVEPTAHLPESKNKLHRGFLRAQWLPTRGGCL